MKKPVTILISLVAALTCIWGIVHFSNTETKKDYSRQMEDGTAKKHDIIAENNAKSEQEVERIKKSLEEGDVLEQEGSERFTVTRKDGSVEEYETVSGIAGFSTIRVK